MRRALATRLRPLTQTWANHLASADVSFGGKHEPGGKMVLIGKSTQIRPQFRVNRLHGHKLDAVDDGQVGSHYPSPLRLQIKSDSIFSWWFGIASFFLVLFGGL